MHYPSLFQKEAELVSKTTILQLIAANQTKYTTIGYKKIKKADSNKKPKTIPIKKPVRNSKEFNFFIFDYR